MRESLQPFIDRSIIVLKDSTPARIAARAMRDHQVGCVVVSDSSQRLVGMVTDRDLCLEILAFDQHPDTPLSELMTRELMSVDCAAAVSEVIHLMAEKGIRRVPVVQEFESGKNKCIGLVTMDDLIISQMVPLDQLSQIVRSQVLRKIRTQRKVRHDKESHEQKLSHFYSVMARNMDLSKPIAERASYFLLKEFLQRIPYANSAHLIAQLPSLLQGDMSSLPAGPNRSMTAEMILDDLTIEFRMDPADARATIRGFWEGLKEALNPQIVAYIESLLPKDFKRLVEYSESPEGDTFISDFSIVHERLEP